LIHISGNAKRENFLVVALATMCLGAAIWKAHPLISQADAQPLKFISIRTIFLHSATDVLAWVAAAFICVTVARLAWTLRRHIAFGTTGYLLLLLLIAFGILGLLDLIRTRNAGTLSPHLDSIGIAVEAVVVIVLLLLLPFIHSIVELGQTAEDEHTRFLTAAKANMNAFFLLEPMCNLGGVQHDFKITFANAKAELLLISPDGKLVHRRISKLLPALQTSGVLGKLIQVGVSGNPIHQDLLLKDPSGAQRAFSLDAFKMSTGIAAVFTDTSERKRFKESVIHLARYDALTGLPNRVLLLERMAQAIDRAHHTRTHLAVLLVTLNKFNRINDSLGYAAGDALLNTVAQRIMNISRPQDTVARIGGDEFVIMLEALDTEAYATVHATNILSSIEEEIEIGDQVLNISASIGICTMAATEADAATMLRYASSAMFEVKKQGISGVLEYSYDICCATSHTLQLEQQLRHATANGEMEVYYQPQVDCKTREIIGVEALLRWNHPERGMVSPGEFIALAEETGTILSLGEWALRQSCKEMASMQERIGRQLSLAVNISSTQFLQDDLAAIVQDALSSSGFTSENLELELTESTLMNDSAQTDTRLKSVLDLGVRLAIDDFGTGFSNFQYILEYNVDCLKIDRSFVSKCPHDSKAAAVVQTIISMARELNILVVAEGVEREDQANFLLDRHCDTCQGYFFHKPMAIDALETLLQCETTIEAGGHHQ